MKVTLLSLLSAVVFLSACKAPFFNTANDLRNINGSVYKNDGTQIDGQITINIENYRASRLYVQVTPKDGKESERIMITDVKGVEIRGDYYEPKLIDMGGIGNNDEFRFVKRLTKEGSRMHLYELFEKRTRQTYNRYGNNNSSYEENDYSYYLVTPGHTRQMPAWNIEGRRLVPNFEDKMSEIVKDCPALAAKIKNKEKGYFYAQVSLLSGKRIETVMSIIDEYNKCK